MVRNAASVAKNCFRQKPSDGARYPQVFLEMGFVNTQSVAECLFWADVILPTQQFAILIVRVHDTSGR